eukprot:PITA_27475
MHYFPELEVWQQDGEIFLGQGRYALEIMKRFRMQDCRPTAMHMITNWKKIDASGDKEVDPTLYRQLIGLLMYLVNTKPNICYAINTLSQFMVEPKRAHWVAAKHILRLGKKFSRQEMYHWVLLWYWIWNDLLVQKRMEATKIFCDNKSCIKLSENLVFHDRSKHIAIRCHFIRDCVQRGVVQLEYTPTGYQVVDVLTKALGRTKFVQFREQMGMLENPFQ